MGITRYAAEQMIQQGAERIRELDRLQQVYGPEPDDFAVVRLQITAGADARTYSYAIVRGGSKWYATGTAVATSLQRGVSWEALCEWMQSFKDVMHYEVIPPPAEFRKLGEADASPRK